MAIADLHHVELLQNATVKLQLVFLELGEHLLAKVDRDQFIELLGGLMLRLRQLHLARHFTHIVLVLECCADGLLT